MTVKLKLLIAACTLWGLGLNAVVIAGVVSVPAWSTSRLTASGHSAQAVAATTPPPTTHPARTTTPTPTPKAVAVRLTAAQKAQVNQILSSSEIHYAGLLAAGKQALGITQYADAWAGLAAFDDPTSAASKFRDWRGSSKAEADVSYVQAFAQADAFYSANNEPANIDVWRDDVASAQGDLIQWVDLAASWQIHTTTTAQLSVAEQKFNADLRAAGQARAAWIAAS